MEPLALVKFARVEVESAVTEPVKVKSSNRAVPPVELDMVYTTVITPVRPDTGLATLVEPINAPVAGTVPEPTEIPLMVIDQFVGPVPERTRQKLKAVTSN